MKVLQAGGDPGLPKGAPVVPGSPLCSSPVSATSPLQPYTTPLPISPPSLTHSPNQMPYSHPTSLVSSHSQHPYSLPKKTDVPVSLGDSQGLEGSREMGAHTPSMGHPPPPPPPPPPHPPQSSQHMGHLPQQYSPYTPPESHGHLQGSQPQDMPNPPSPNAMSNAGHHPPTSVSSHCYQQQQSHLSHYHTHHPSHSSPLQSSQDSPHMGLSGSSCLPQSQSQLLYPPVKEEYMPPPPSSSPQVPNSSSSIAHQPPPPSSPQNSYHWQQVKQEHSSYPYSWYNSDHLHLYH